MLYLKNGEVIDSNQVSIEDRAFLYGDGCFTTIRIKAGQAVLWDRHLARLRQGVTALRMQCEIEQICAAKEKALQMWAEPEAILKIVISRGTSARGYMIPQQAADIYCYLYSCPQKMDSQPSILNHVGIMPDRLATSFAPLKGIKTLNRLEQVLLKSQAVDYGWDEAFCFDDRNGLVEGISSNCFIYLNGEWCSPDLQFAGIDGIMRQEILSRMQDYAIPHQIRMISHSEIQQMQAGFFCNALNPMQIIHQMKFEPTAKSMDQKLCFNLFKSLQLQQLV